MMKNNRVFQAFEYGTYNTLNEGKEGKKLPDDLFTALKSFAAEKDLSYFALTANGVRFQNYVGALQIGKWTVEVFPKVDRNLDEASTQPILIQMLRQAGMIRIQTPSVSHLKLRRNYILESYLQLFLDETRTLIHKGLIKKYRKQEENEFSLQGKLIFDKHLYKNLTHAERFFIRHTIYDRQHELNRILYKTLNLIIKLQVENKMISEAQSLIFSFPELDDIRVSQRFFSKLTWGRKSIAYKKAIEISKLLLLNYHPDLSHGPNSVLALMFDMNALWEKWFYTRMKNLADEIPEKIKIIPQKKKVFWINTLGEKVPQKPDIILVKENGTNYILDTKWKVPGDKPSEQDLRQMFVYNKLFKSTQAYLVYPGVDKSVSGTYFNSLENGHCALKFIPYLEKGKLTSNGILDLLNELI